MRRENENQEGVSDSSHEIELYGDPGIASFNAKVSKFLLATYIILPIWGFVSLYIFWNGSVGWFDRGYWHELQIAANTTFPIENQNMLYDKPSLKEEPIEKSIQN